MSSVPSQGCTPTERVVAAAEALARGRAAVIVDDVGDWGGILAYQARGMAAASMAHMIRHTSGLIAVVLEPERVQALQLPMMVPHVNDGWSLPFAVTVDAKEGTTTGISAPDRATTVRALVDAQTGASGLARPGHVIPIPADRNGVLGRHLTADAAYDLTRVAAEVAGAAIGSIVDESGAVLNARGLTDFAERESSPVVTVTEVMRYRLARDRLVARVVGAPGAAAPAGEPPRVVGFESVLDSAVHVTVVGDLSAPGSVVHVVRECVVGHLFDAGRCSCRAATEAALEQVRSSGVGALVVLRGDQGHGVAHARSPERQGAEPAHDVDPRRILRAAVPARIIRELTDEPVRVAGDPAIVADLQWLDPSLTELR